jgi:hypothetical protein
MSLNSSTTTAMTHKFHNQSSSGWTQLSLAPLLALRTRCDRVNDSSQFSMPMINTLVTLLSLPGFNAKSTSVSSAFTGAGAEAGSSALRTTFRPIASSKSASISSAAAALRLRFLRPRRYSEGDVVLFELVVVVVGGRRDCSSFQR